MSDGGKLEELFWQAQRFTGTVERQRFLQSVCGDDVELMNRTMSLLQHADEAGEFLEDPARWQSGKAETTSSAVLESKACKEFPFLSPPLIADSIGTLGQYHIQCPIGRGGMGIVFQAFDPKLERVVAIKVLAPEIALDPVARARFEREARSVAAITHPNIVVIHSVEDQHNPPYLVMELVHGKTLGEKLKAQGALSLKEILRIGIQVADGLAAAHKQGVIHRDVKPSNILLENGIERAKVTDFGLAISGKGSALTRTGDVTGTPDYMSPEQATGKTIDHRTDLFSLGAVLYVMCTGYPPFSADTLVATFYRILNDHPTPIQQLNVDVPIWLSSIVDRLLAKSPADRFQSATEVARLLRRHLARIQLGPNVGKQADVPHRTSVATRFQVTPSLTKTIKVSVVLGFVFLLSISILRWNATRRSADPKLLAGMKQVPTGIINGDFSSGLTGWEREGETQNFIVCPINAKRTIIGFTTGPGGKFKETGRIYQSFIVPNDAEKLVCYLHGSSSASTYVAIREGAKTLWKQSRPNRQEPVRFEYGLKNLRGKLITFEIVDYNRGNYGYIGAHGIRILPVSTPHK